MVYYLFLYLLNKLDRTSMRLKKNRALCSGTDFVKSRNTWEIASVRIVKWH